MARSCVAPRSASLASRSATALSCALVGPGWFCGLYRLPARRGSRRSTWPSRTSPGRAVAALTSTGSSVVRLTLLEDVLANAPGGQRLGPRTCRHDIVGEPIGSDEDLQTRRHDRAASGVRGDLHGDDLAGARGGSPLGRASTCSMPSTTSPQTVYWSSRKRASSKQMKNWLLAEFGCGGARHGADAAHVRLLGELRLQVGLGRAAASRCRSGSPPWAMKPGITRWKTTPS